MVEFGGITATSKYSDNSSFDKSKSIAAAYFAFCLIGFFVAVVGAVACAFLALDAISGKWPVPALSPKLLALIALGVAFFFSLGALVLIGAGWPALRKKDCEARQTGGSSSSSCNTDSYKVFIGKEETAGSKSSFGGGVGYGFECVGALFALVALVLVLVGGKEAK